ncbi:hypothetical protein QOZ80_1BG0064690 [Eleusine coracana subsp. coracana]|nr:hypothetical protein QOZ80_1BG0064690 [Eleusine coracana subsp. coracana]
MSEWSVDMGHGDNAVGGQGGNAVGGQGGNATGRAAMCWTSVMSGFVLRRFVDLVGQGVKTNKGFKEVHVNQVARNLSDFIGQEVTGTQVYNHLRKWRQRWVKVYRLKDLSGALWDEDTCTIVLDDEHLRGHIKDHPKDAEFLNVPIENYNPMQVIFRAGQATGRYAMGSNEPLGTLSNITDTHMTEGVTQDDAVGSVGAGGSGGAGTYAAATSASVNGNGITTGTTSHGAKGSDSEEPVNPRKRRRSLTDEEVSIMTGLTGVVHRIADAFEAPVVV